MGSRASAAARRRLAEMPARLQEYDNLLALLEGASQWQVVLDVAPVLREAARGARVWFDARALTMEALALEHLGRKDAADSLWDEALARGEEGSFVRVYLDGDRARIRLLERAVSRHESEWHARRVMESAPEFRVLSSDEASLTPAQVTVLRLVGDGHSNQQVAKELGVALTTVKAPPRHLRTHGGSFPNPGCCPSPPRRHPSTLNGGRRTSDLAQWRIAQDWPITNASGRMVRHSCLR